jgi:polyisoprenoid-binding protein YceI
MTNTRAATRHTAAGVPAPGRYRIDFDRSSVTFRARHLFGLGVVSGTMAITHAEMTIDPGRGQATVTAVISAASFSTGNRARDRDVRSAKFLDTGQYPDITFQGGTLSRDQRRWTLAGDLTVRQVSSPVLLAIEAIELAGAGFQAHAATRIDRYTFNVTAAKGMAARYLGINLAVTAEPWQPQR